MRSASFRVLVASLATLHLPRLSLLLFGKEVHFSALFCTFLLLSHAMELEVAASSCPESAVAVPLLL
jgi:hypothetical protein